MASINTIVKRKQYLWLGIVVVGTASAIGGALYLSDVDMSGNGETVAEQEPVPDMTGVVDTGCLSRTVLLRRKKAGPTFWKWKTW